MKLNVIPEPGQTLDLVSEELDEWVSHAKNHGYGYLIIVKDLTDRVVFPVYVVRKESVEAMKKCFISESKMKVLGVIDVGRK